MLRMSVGNSFGSTVDTSAMRNGGSSIYQSLAISYMATATEHAFRRF